MDAARTGVDRGEEFQCDQGSTTYQPYVEIPVGAPGEVLQNPGRKSLGSLRSRFRVHPRLGEPEIPRYRTDRRLEAGRKRLCLRQAQHSLRVGESACDPVHIAGAALDDAEHIHRRTTDHDHRNLFAGRLEEISDGCQSVFDREFWGPLRVKQ